MTPQPVAPGSVLLHIGPHKTGTTALQSGAASRRAQLEAEGVTYPLHKGRDHHSAAAMAVGGRKWGWVERGGHYVPEERWTSLVEEVHAAPDRVFISSEFFAALCKMVPGLTTADIVASRVARARDVLAVSTRNYSSEVMPPLETSLPHVFIANSAQIAHGTLNVNETVSLAERQALALHSRLASRTAVAA